MNNLETLRKINRGLRVVNIIASIGSAITFWCIANSSPSFLGDGFIGLNVVAGFLVLILGIVFACFIYCIVEAFADLVTNSFAKNTSNKILDNDSNENELPEL